MDLDRLSGWKEIAAHLRRSVRAAQRWEHELGLPVRRVRTVAGQVVFASRAELDAWLAQQAAIHRTPIETPDVAARDGGDRPLDAGHVVTPVTPPLPQRRRLATVVGIAILALVIIGAWVWRPGASSATVSAVALVDTRLEARDARGRLIWVHQFDQAVQMLSLHDSPRGYASTIESVDLDGDGRTEWLVALRFGANLAELRQSDAVLAFSASGTLRWTATVPDTLSLTCGGTPFYGPWQLSVLSVPRRAGPKSVWVAFHHPVRWPSFVMEVTPDGSMTRRYVQAGWIRGILDRDTPGRRRLEIAGVLNDHERASLVSIDPDLPLTALPPASPAFACDLDEPAAPLRAVLFPPHDVSAAYQHKYFLATSVSGFGDGLRVELAGGSAVAMVDAGGTVTDVTFIDEYWLQHDQLFQAGRLDHRSDQCPQATTAGQIEAWYGSGWTTYPVRRAMPAPAPRPTSR